MAEIVLAECDVCGHSYKGPECPSCGDDAADLTEKIKWFEEYETQTQESREMAEKDRAYYDGKQWTAAQRAKLLERKQPPIVINRIFEKINDLIGQEIESRTDPKALPRTPQHEEDTYAITDALRYVADTEDADKIFSDGWEEGAIEGAYAAVVEVEPEPPYDTKLRYIRYDRFFHDPHSRESDYSDAKYLGISTWWDFEDAVDWFEAQPDAVENVRDVLEASLQKTGEGEAHGDRPSFWADKARKRVRTIECYYRHDGVYHVCFLCPGGWLIKPKPTGYKDEKGRDVCPIVANSAYVERENNFRYGLVRQLIGLQDELNHRRSKALRWSSVDRVIAEEGAVLDPDEAQTEYAKPDGWITVQRDALSGNKVQFINGAQMAQAQIGLQAEAKSELDRAGPDGGAVTADESLSGRALMFREKIANRKIARFKDNHRRWKEKIFRQVWYRIKQFKKEEWWMRVRDDAQKVGYRFVGLNRRMSKAERLSELLEKKVPIESALKGVNVDPNVLQEVSQGLVQQLGPAAQQVPPQQLQLMAVEALKQREELQEEMTAADTSLLDVDVLIEESPDTSVLQFEEAEALDRMLPTIINTKPDLAEKLLELRIEASQIRSKARLLELLRQPPDPQAAQMQQMQAQLQMAMLKANADMMSAEAIKSQARAQRDQVEAQKASVEVQAEIAKTQAEVAKTQAETQLGIPARAEKDKAQAMKAAADAGAKTSDVLAGEAE